MSHAQTAGLSKSQDEHPNTWDGETSGTDSYDELELDPDTLLARSVAETQKGGLEIKLDQTSRNGKYLLIPNDPETKEILRKGLEREEVEATGKKPRTSFHHLVFTRQFTAFDRQNPSASTSPFFGFFTLFWIAMVLLFCQVAMHNYRDYGSILGRNQVLKMMFSHDVLVLGFTDGVMCLACMEGLLFQKLVHRGWIRWEREGWIIQNIWQSLYLAAVVGWTYYREWPWTHTIFAVLHGLVFLMKQHSYAFYNGYLSRVLLRRTLLEQKLEQLEAMEPNASAPTSPVSPKAVFDSVSGINTEKLSHRINGQAATKRRSMSSRTSIDLGREETEVARIARAVERGTAIDASQMTTFANIIRAEIAILTKELSGGRSSSSTTDSNTTSVPSSYPQNLTLLNFLDWTCLPTLVYELSYPRQKSINWWYVSEKLLATAGVLCVMMVISQAYIYPPVARTVTMKQSGMSLEQRSRELPYIVSDMLFPLLIEQLLTWYLIWECILNLLAELTRFADRGFYGAWWNSVTWDQYARDWNRPVVSQRPCLLSPPTTHACITTDQELLPPAQFPPPPRLPLLHLDFPPQPARRDFRHFPAVRSRA